MMVLREMIGQKLAICPSMSSKWVNFCWAVRRRAAGMFSSSSSTRPLRGEVGDFFSQVKSLARNGAKFESRDKQYCKLWRHDSKEVMVSCLVKDHCLGALPEFILRQVIGTERK